MDNIELYIKHLLEKGADAREISSKCSNKYGVDEYLLFDMVEHILNHKNDNEYLKAMIEGDAIKATA